MPRPRVQADRTQMAHVPAPILGVDTVSSGTTMPAGYSILSYNLIGSEFGLRSRLGWREWVTGITDAQIRSLLPFSGSAGGGGSGRLFACTTTGIWDVSASTTTPTQVVVFPNATTVSGFGISTSFVNVAGTHYLCYCDDENGYYLYSETTDTWTKILAAATSAWVTGTVYAAGATVSNAGLSYVTAAGGTAGGAAPTGTGTGINDGAVLWDYYPSVGNVDPDSLAFVMGWKNRLWFVEKDTASGWYLDIGAVTGPAVKFNFGARFKAGGDLRGLWSWTYDGGSGIDDALVAVSGGGDVVIYRGTDPAFAETFALTGVWYAGTVPAGRRLCTDFGGDLLFMSSTGIQSLSKLTSGGAVNSSQYETYRIANLFNQLQNSSSSLLGWSMVLHPEDACLMVVVPVSAGVATEQLVMSTTTKGWHRYRDMPMGVSAAPWDGWLFFGTEDGRVCVNTGDVDGVLLADPSSYTPIYWSALTGFSNMGRPTQKIVHFLRPSIVATQGNIPHDIEARYSWDLDEIAAISSAAPSSGALWGTAIWGTSLWGGTYVAEQRVRGAVGMGAEVAIAIRGAASSRMTWTGVDVTYEEGGFL